MGRARGFSRATVANYGMLCRGCVFIRSGKVVAVALFVIYSIALVAFGGLCGSALLWCIHGRPLEAKQKSAETRLVKAEKCLAANDRVYQHHYGILSRQMQYLDERVMAMAREMPTRPPPRP
jgi:hypothetical protein